MTAVGQLEMVAIGQIERSFGVKGEVKVRSLSDAPGRWDSLTTVSLVAKDGRAMDTQVTHVRRAGSGFIVGLAGLTTPEAAGQWRGGYIQVPRGTVPALPDGQYYQCDLIGLSVCSDQGQLIGTLEQIWDLPGNHVFVVRGETGEVLIPAAKELIVAVDLEQRIMTVRMIEGLGA